MTAGAFARVRRDTRREPAPRLRTAHIVSFTAGNVTSVLYRNHTSCIEGPAPETGRGVRSNYAVRFH